MPTVPARPSLAEVPPAPRQPSLRARKLIFRYTGTQWVLRLVGAIFVAIGIPLVVPFVWGLPSDVAISLDKREVPGRLLRVARASYTVNDESPTRVFYSYEFGGKRYQADSDVFSDSKFSLADAEQAEGPVPVEVAAFHPAYARIAGTRNSVFGPLALLTLIFPLLGGLLLFFAIRSNRREIRAFVHGVPTLAKVVSVGEDGSTSIHGKHPFVVSYEFKVDGEAYAGSLSSMLHLDLEEFLAADEVVALYDPQRPQINTLYVR